MAGPPKVLSLNVGGYAYTTTLYTVSQFPESTLAKMLTSENETAAKDTRGNYFIDRDGALFKYVLNFLRTKKLILPEDFQEFEQLEIEAKFFAIKPLEEAVEEVRNSRNRQKTAGKAVEELLRLFFSSKTGVVLGGVENTLQQVIPDAKQLGGTFLKGPSYHFLAGEDRVEGGQVKVPIKLEQLDAFLQHVLNQGFEIKMSNFSMDGNTSQVWIFTRKF